MPPESEGRAVSAAQPTALHRERALDQARMRPRQAVKRAMSCPHGVLHNQQLGEHAAQNRIADAGARCSQPGSARPARRVHRQRRCAPAAAYRAEPHRVPLLPGCSAIEPCTSAGASFRGCRSWRLPRRPSAVELLDVLREDRRRLCAVYPLRRITCRSTSGASSTTPRAGARIHFYDKAKPVDEIGIAARPATIEAVSRMPQCDGRRCGRRARCIWRSSPERGFRRTPGVANFRPWLTCRWSSRRAAVSGSVARRAEWRVGECWVFDDTDRARGLERQRARQRYVLILDVWSPRLSPE